jgi:hypothetical protein
MLTDATGAPFDVTNATLAFTLLDMNGTPVFPLAASISKTDAPNGAISVDIPAFPASPAARIIWPSLRVARVPFASAPSAGLILFKFINQLDGTMLVDQFGWDQPLAIAFALLFPLVVLDVGLIEPQINT